MSLPLNDLSVGIDEVKLHTAELGTGTTIGTAPKAMLRGKAQAAEADAEGTVYERLKLDIGNLTMYLSYFL